MAMIWFLKDDPNAPCELTDDDLKIINNAARKAIDYGGASPTTTWKAVFIGAYEKGMSAGDFYRAGMAAWEESRVEKRVRRQLTAVIRQSVLEEVRDRIASIQPDVSDTEEPHKIGHRYGHKLLQSRINDMLSALIAGEDYDAYAPEENS